jgi:hypothetical protein
MKRLTFYVSLFFCLKYLLINIEMKKLFLLIIVLSIITACGSSKHNCPAYGDNGKPMENVA